MRHADPNFLAFLVVVIVLAGFALASGGFAGLRAHFQSSPIGISVDGELHTVPRPNDPATTGVIRPAPRPTR